MTVKFLRQCTFIWLLLVSVVLVYVAAIVGVYEGWLEEEVSWTKPVFVALFEDEAYEAGNFEGAGFKGNNAGGASRNNMENFADGGGEQEGCDGSLTAAGNVENGNCLTEVEGVGDVWDCMKETENTGDGGSLTEENGEDTENSAGRYEEWESFAGEYTEQGTLVSEYTGQVEYVKTEMRYARSHYYNDSDTLALTSKLEYVNVENDYFSDACFIGDSRIEGLYFYGGLREADYYYKPGITVYDLMDKQLLCNGSASGCTDIAAALSQKQYGKIYIMVGVNELGDKTSAEYREAYEENIGRIKELQPDAVIFIIGMMHVTTEYSEASDVFNNDNIDDRNTEAAGIANGRDIFYLDMNECVDDGCGGVIKDYSHDGVHLKAEYYKVWTDWMKAHGVDGL